MEQKTTTIKAALPHFLGAALAEANKPPPNPCIEHQCIARHINLCYYRGPPLQNHEAPLMSSSAWNNWRFFFFFPSASGCSIFVILNLPQAERLTQPQSRLIGGAGERGGPLNANTSYESSLSADSSVTNEDLRSWLRIQADGGGFFCVCGKVQSTVILSTQDTNPRPH